MPAMSMPEGGPSAPARGPEAPTLPGPPMSRADLEQIAVKYNPTLAQAQNLIEAAEGRSVQAGLYPNPSFGYNGENATPALNGGDQGFIFQQTIVTANKLGLNRQIARKAKDQVVEEAKVQRYRVLNAVDLLYYDALAARRIVAVRAELSRLADQAVDITDRLKNVGQADAPDLLQAQADANLEHIALATAINEQAQVWRELTAVTGNPDLQPHELAGTLDTLPEIDPNSALGAILESSPEVRVAELGIERAKAALARAKVEPIPNVNFIAGLRNNFERLPERTGPFIGPDALAEITVTVPIFDRNQGNIAATRAEIAHAKNEVARVKLELRARFAPVFASYLTAAKAAERYRSQIIPETRTAYQLYLQRFEQMAAAFPQVLIAQRTLFQAEEGYVENLRAGWEAVVQIKGMLLSGGLAAPQAPSAGSVPAAAVPSAAEITQTSPGG